MAPSNPVRRVELRWFKSSYSGANETECVEAARVPEGTAIRDSKDPLGPRLAFTTRAWRDFASAVGAGRVG
ncbi:DUF397 domain-containing protein [Streptomyces sp. NPDC002133]|uniref:DUF397 domain-containing protein n=1 Tax=Streptomyces sp. NPDC002133 TaxID=3154409 RepID=UPI00331E5C3A